LGLRGLFYGEIYFIFSLFAQQIWEEEGVLMHTVGLGADA